MRVRSLLEVIGYKMESGSFTEIIRAGGCGLACGTENCFKHWLQVSRMDIEFTRARARLRYVCFTGSSLSRCQLTQCMRSPRKVIVGEFVLEEGIN